MVTGNDLVAQVQHLDASIDTFNIYTSHYDVAHLNVKGMTTVFEQVKPLEIPEPDAKAIADATAPITMKLNVGKVDLDDVKVTYNNAPSALYTQFDIDRLLMDGRNLDLQRNLVHLDELQLNNTASEDDGIWPRDACQLAINQYLDFSEWRVPVQLTALGERVDLGL